MLFFSFKIFGLNHVACGILVSQPTRDRTSVPSNGSVESQPLDLPGNYLGMCINTTFLKGNLTMSKQYPVVDVTGDRSKVQCCKEQYCIGMWNVRSMNQGKLEMVKQEMARVNVDILGISELKWTGMGEFNSDDHYIYDCGQESLRRNGVAIMANKRVKNAYLNAISKMTE